MTSTIPEIPKILHHQWLDIKVEDNANPPEKYIKMGYLEGWRSNHLDYEHFFWNRKMVKDLLFAEPVFEKYKNFYYNVLNKHIQRCDFARYMIMYKYGGLYVDLDIKNMLNVDSILKNREMLLFWEPSEHTPWPFGTRVFNGIFGSIPKHNFWLEFMDYIVANYSTVLGVLATTGPIILRKFIVMKKYYQKCDLWFGNTCWFLSVVNFKRYCRKCLHQKPEPQEPVNRIRLSSKRERSLKECINFPFDDNQRYGVTYWQEGGGWATGFYPSVLGADNKKKYALFSDQRADQKNFMWIILVVVIVIIVVSIAIALIVLYRGGGKSKNPNSKTTIAKIK